LARADRPNLSDMRNLFLVQVEYTAEAWKHLLDHPDDRNRLEAVRPVVEQSGGLIVFKDFAPGGDDPDVVAIIQFPDLASAFAFRVAVMAGGFVKSVKVTPLLTMAEGDAAMTRAVDLHYAFPTPAATGSGRRSRKTARRE
jgi:uncharacterized protein with GYD domain